MEHVKIPKPETFTCYLSWYRHEKCFKSLEAFFRDLTYCHLVDIGLFPLQAMQ